MDIKSLAKAAREASYEISGYTRAQKDDMLRGMAAAILSASGLILKENALDVKNAEGHKDATFIDRLTLTPARIEAMCEGIRQIAELPDPVGEIVESWVTQTGLSISKVRAPLGVVAIIYEARPNVTADAAALCIKSGNAVILKGGTDAINSNRAIYNAMRSALEGCGCNADSVLFVDDTDRAATAELLKMDDYVDVIIPRGGEGLKHFILENSKIPVIASAGGNCHVYVEKSADLNMAKEIVYNAKLQRPSVCNAMEHLLVDKEIAEDFLPECLQHLTEKGVEILGDEKTRELFPKAGIATDKEYATEYENYKMTSTVVENTEEAIKHINKFSTKHSEAIVTNSDVAASKFSKEVDSAALYINASTRFTDGFEFGFGAEMGISTGKLHARGPLGLRELTSVKYVVTGTGNLRK